MNFSKKESVHLTISVLVMSVLLATHGGLISVIGSGINVVLSLLAASFLIIVPAFVLHEIGHKYMAQKFGFWAEYRMWTQGLLLAVLITIITAGRFLFIAPGAVYFAMHRFTKSSAEKIGKIGLSGPIVNLFLGVIFGLISLIIWDKLWAGFFRSGAGVNAFLAIFNLIPVTPLDGQKVFAWNKKIWATTIILAILLFILLNIVF